MSDYMHEFWKAQSEACTADIVDLIVPRLLAFSDRLMLTESQTVELVRLVSQITGDVMLRCRDLASDVIHDTVREMKQ